MFKTFTATLSPMLVMFIYIIIGYIASKFKVVHSGTATVLSKLENYIFVPALIINTFMKYCTVQSISGEFKLIIYCIIILVIALLISLPSSKLFSKSDEYRRNIYKYALTFGNFSFMGNAIVPAILGENMLYSYMLYILPLNIAVYTWGVTILVPKHEEKQSFLKSVINPIFISIIIGAVLGLTGASKIVPDFVNTAVSGCSSCMGPLAMILTGMVISKYDILKLLKNYKVYIATALRLVVLPAVFLLVLSFIGASHTVKVLTLFAYGTPLGLNTVVFPAAYGGDTSTGASMAMISHTLCVITIPLMYSMISIFS